MNSADDLALLGRVMGSLLVVLVVLGLITRLVRRRPGSDLGLRVIDRVGLTREANLTVVEVANRVLLLGVTAQGVTLLVDLDPPAVEPAPLRAPTRRAGRHDWDDQGRPDSGEETRPDRNRHRGADLDLDLDLAADFDRDLGAGLGADLGAGGGHDGEGPDFGTPVPAAVALDEHPDLASALRAAGRIAGPSATDHFSSTGFNAPGGFSAPPGFSPPASLGGPAGGRGTKGSGSSRGEARTGTRPMLWSDAITSARPVSGGNPGVPRSRAEVRARQAPGAGRGLRIPHQRGRLSSEPRVTRIDDDVRSGPTGSTGLAARSVDGIETGRDRPTPSSVQASGSVLSPKTWRQGIDALRDLTVRRN